MPEAENAHLDVVPNHITSKCGFEENHLKC